MQFCSGKDLQYSTEPVRNDVYRRASIINVRKVFSWITAAARDRSIPCISSKTWLAMTIQKPSKRYSLNRLALKDDVKQCDKVHYGEHSNDRI